VCDRHKAGKNMNYSLSLAIGWWDWNMCEKRLEKQIGVRSYKPDKGILFFFLFPCNKNQLFFNCDSV
jgi:hypothetical protein